MHEGHRQRMLDRLNGDGAGLKDHEILEILLFGVIPRRNTNEIAHRLLDAFGSLKGVFSADREQLKSVEGVGEAAAAHLCCTGLCFKRIQGKEETAPALFNVATFSGYLQKRYAAFKKEVIEVFCLDAKDRIKQIKQFTSDEKEKAYAAPNDFAAFVLASKPASIVVAHNHPVGSNAPSRKDDNFTAQLRLFCSMNNIKFYDHFIVGAEGCYSYCLSGRMRTISNNFDLETLLKEKGLL